MKKGLAMALVFLILLPLWGCKKTQPSQPPAVGVRAGFGRQSITPETSVPMAGYGDSMERMCQGILDKLYVTCVAITDQSNQTVLLFSLDILTLPADLVEPLRAVAAEASGVTSERIMLCATGTHSGPDLTSAYGNSLEIYKKLLSDAVAAAAQEAMEDRAATVLRIGTAQAEGLTHVGHYTRQDGSVWEEGSSQPAGELTGHVAEADDRVNLIRLDRSKKKDILLANWQSQAILASTDTTDRGRDTRVLLSADFVGPARSYVEREAGVLFAYFQGAGANLSPFSAMEDETYTEDVTKYGQQLGKTILAGLRNMTKATAGPVNTKQRVYVGNVDHTQDALAEPARQILDKWEQTKDLAACLDIGAAYGIHSVDHARSILRRRAMEKTLTFELNVIRIGDISFATVPGGMFDANGRYVRENSICAMTFLLCGANGDIGVLPAASAYEYGCSQAYTGLLQKGTAENVAARLVDMLYRIQ